MGCLRARGPILLNLWMPARSSHGEQTVCIRRTGITLPIVRDLPQAGSEGKEPQNIEVWNDLVSPRDLVVCLLVSAVCAVAAILISSAAGGQTLFWGLGASVVGFTVNCFLVVPKREVDIVDELDPVEAAEGGAE